VYGAVVVVETVLTIAYFVGLWSYTGRDARAADLPAPSHRRQHRRAISLGKALLRWLASFISSIACFIGLIWVAFDSRKQGGLTRSPALWCSGGSRRYAEPSAAAVCRPGQLRGILDPPPRAAPRRLILASHSGYLLHICERVGRCSRQLQLERPAQGAAVALFGGVFLLLYLFSLVLQSATGSISGAAPARRWECGCSAADRRCEDGGPSDMAGPRSVCS